MSVNEFAVWVTFSIFALLGLIKVIKNRPNAASETAFGYVVREVYDDCREIVRRLREKLRREG